MNTRKVFTSLFISIFIFSNAAAFAQMSVAVPGIASSLGELSKIGVVAAIQGKVEVMTPGAAGRVVQSGEEIFIGDEVKTDALGHLQILLLDETVFTIGSNSAIIIDKFIYDPATHEGNVEASITKGVFRYISGKIAAKKPENVTIKLPTATIGIRGTIVAGEASAAGSMAMLLGPGSKNETGATIGSFVISGTGGNSGQQEHVNRTGFGVSVDQAGSLSGVFLVPEAQVHHLSTSLVPAQGQGSGPAGRETDPNVPRGERTPNQAPSGAQPATGPVPATVPGALAIGSGSAPLGPISGPGGTTGDASTRGPAPMTTTSFFGSGDMGKISGEQMFAGFETTRQVNMLGMLETGLSQDSTIASQDALHNSAVQNANTQTVRDTLKRDMFARIAPVINYQHYGGYFDFNGLRGTLDAMIRVDFGTDKVLGGPGSFISINVKDGISAGTDLVDGCELGAVGKDQLFNVITNDSDPATFTWTNANIDPTKRIAQQGLPTFDPSGIFTKVTVQFQDVISQPIAGTTASQVDIAAQVKVAVDYSRPNTPAPDIGSGEIIAPEVV
jgi:hypothetical protein